MPHYSIVLHKGFWDDYNQLPHHIQEKTSDLITKMVVNPFAENLDSEKLHLAEEGMYSSRVDLKYRLIWKLIKDQIVLCLVDNHDPAYNRAMRKTFLLEDGIVRIVDILEVGAKKPETTETAWFGLKKKPRPGELFITYTDKELLEMGVPEDYLENIRYIDNVSQFQQFEYRLPEDVFYRLAAIALGEVERPIVPEEELHRSINRYQGGEDLYKFVHSDDFKRALNGSMEEWMLFLAPHQKLLTLRKFNGSARIKGVAGSGKTVVAIHRLSVLAHNLGSSGKKVIFLTFGSRLPNIAKHLTKRLAGDKISVDELIEFTTFHQWCRRFLVNNHRLVKVDEDRLDGILNHAIHQTRQHFLDLNLWQRPTKFFQDEIQYAIKGRGVSTLEDYLKLDRSGRGTALKDIERRAMFQVSEAYQSQLKQNNLCDFQDWILMALDLLESKAVSFQKYAAAVVDEIQDLTETQMRLVRALVEPGENDLFLVGDGLQRLYAGGYSLRNLGINITGRSAVLIHNYRNTYEIMNTAHSMMSHTPYDDMDEEMEKPIEPILSVRHGEVPSLWCFPTMQEEIAWIGTEIQRLQRECGYREADFALLYRHHQPYKQLITDNLGSKMRLSEVDKSPESFFGDGIKHTTFDSSKGLEFKIVFIVGVTDGVYVPRDEFTYEGTELTEYLERERSRLYVAMTRARDLLYLTYSGGQPSRFLSGIPDTLLHRV